MDTGNCSEHPLVAFRRHILFSYAGNRELKYREPLPASTLRSISIGRQAHANIICESSVFSVRAARDSAESMRARGIHGVAPRRRREGRARVPAQMDHCSRRCFDDHPRPNKTIETSRSTVPDCDRPGHPSCRPSRTIRTHVSLLFLCGVSPSGWMKRTMQRWAILKCL